MSWIFCSISWSSKPRKEKTVKKVARYQQFESVNDIVDRTVSQIGKNVDSQDRTGLIWHTQGSGKSLTMVFTAYKLRRDPALNNPTVMIVVDRRDPGSSQTSRLCRCTEKSYAAAS